MVCSGDFDSQVMNRYFAEQFTECPRFDGSCGGLTYAEQLTTVPCTVSIMICAGNSGTWGKSS